MEAVFFEPKKETRQLGSEKNCSFERHIEIDSERVQLLCALFTKAINAVLRERNSCSKEFV